MENMIFYEFITFDTDFVGLRLVLQFVS